MSLVPVRELRNHTAEVIERARNREEATITVNGMPAPSLVPVRSAHKYYSRVCSFRRDWSCLDHAERSGIMRISSLEFSRDRYRSNQTRL